MTLEKLKPDPEPTSIKFNERLYILNQGHKLGGPVRTGHVSINISFILFNTSFFSFRKKTLVSKLWFLTRATGVRAERLISELLWATPNYPDLLWASINYTELSWAILGYSELPWVILSDSELSWATLSWVKLLWTTRSHYESVWSTLNYPGLLWTTLSYSELSWVTLRVTVSYSMLHVRLYGPHAIPPRLPLHCPKI